MTMDGYLLAWRFLTNAAVGGTIVLAVGSLAAWLCRRPAERARIVILTLLGGLAVPWAAYMPVAPKWSAGLLPAPAAVAPAAALPVSETAGAPKTGAAHAAINRPGAPAAREPGRLAMVHRAASSGRTIAGAPPGRRSRGSTVAVSWPAVIVGLYLAASIGLAAWWLVGQGLLWRIRRRARAAPAHIEKIFHEIAGPGGQAVVLLESDLVKLPFTYTWARPVIVLPSALCSAGESQELRFALAHEWSHIERHDALAWNFAALASFVLFYQPLFWWLRRQLRLCQDYLADDRAAALGSAEDYANYLVNLARARSGLALPALGIGGRRTNLFRRITMLVHDHEPLAHRCRAIFSAAATLSTVVVILAASGFRLDAGPASAGAMPQETKSAPAGPKDDAKPKDEAKPSTGATRKAEAARTWKGRVTEKGTGRPIAGADVVVEISVSRDPLTNEPKTLREVHHTTGPDGAYEFTISPAEAAERLLYITLIVEDRDHVGYFGGYSYAMILKNEKLGERPFYENLELWPGKAIEGVVQTPDGVPAASVKIQAFSSPESDRIFDHGRFAETKTDERGRFRLVLHQKGKAVFWILPLEYAPETHGLKNDLRGDLGKFVLAPGIRFGGRVLDVTGKPVAGIYVEADIEKKERSDDDAVPSGIADMEHRSTLTAADGTFAFRPLPPGEYRVCPSERGWDPSTREGAHDPPRRPLPGVFTAQMVELKQGKATEPLEIRAVPHVVVEAQVYNSKGQKRSSHEINVAGEIDGRFWYASCQPTADGAYRILAPHGLENAHISLITNEHSALQFRTAKDAPLQQNREIRLGTLDHDVTGIEIIRYEAPIIIIGAATKDGKPVRDFTASVNYTEVGEHRDGRYILKGGTHSDVSLEEHGVGRYRTSQLVPDREVVVTVKAEGFAPASRKMTLPEGKNEEVTIVLEPK